MTIQDYIIKEIDALLDIIPRWQMQERAAKWRYELNPTGEKMLELLELHFQIKYGIERIDFCNRLLRNFPA